MPFGCTFALLFHQPDNVMQIRILALICFFQFFVACQQDNGKLRLSEANLGTSSVAASEQGKETNSPVAADIVFQSSDGGLTWQDVSAGLPKELGIGCIFAAGGKIFLGSESGLYHTRTGAATPIWENEFFLDKRITDIFPGSTGLYTSSYGRGFYKEIQGSNIWIPMHHNLPDNTVLTVLETTDGMLFVGCESGIFKSANDGKTWKQVYDKGQVVSLVVSDGVMVGGGSNGLLRSTDGGENWLSVVTEDGSFRKTGIMQGGFFAISNGKQVIGDPKSRANRMRTSTDGGKTWQRIDEHLSALRYIYGKDKQLSSVQFINDAEQTDGNLFCSLDAGVYRSADQGKTWKLVLPASRKMSFNLAISGKMIYAVIAGGC